MEKQLTPEKFDFLKQINLYEVLGEESALELLSKLNIESTPETKEYKKQSSKVNMKKINRALFEKNNFIFQLLNLIYLSMHKHKEMLLAKAIQWVTREIQGTLTFKADSSTIISMEMMKNENQDLNTIINWLEEYSTMNNKQKENITIVKSQKPKSPKAQDRLKIYNPSYKMNKGNLFQIESPNFNIFQLEEEVGSENTLGTIACYIFISLKMNAFVNFEKLEKFLEAIRKGYNRTVPYHNDLHAADVLQTCFMYYCYSNFKNTMKLDELDIFAFFISAIVHDFRHPGYTNSYIINSQHEISLLYNDKSVLENYHVSETFKLIHLRPELNIFSEKTPQQFKLLRKRIIECVLATDMSYHASIMSFLKIKRESFGVKLGKNTEKIFENSDNLALFNLQQEFLNNFLHAADISNSTKPFHIYSKWVDKLMTEFWRQGDQEKELLLPISFLCDRTTTSVPGSQVGFIDGIILPYFQVIVDFFPFLKPLVENAKTNKESYRVMFENEKKLKNK